MDQEQHAATDVALERHYTPQEVAELWGVSAKTIQRVFRGLPGVIELGNDETRWARKHKTMRIPESVIVQVHESYRSGAHRGHAKLSYVVPRIAGR
jgi:hypothetical protein